MVSWFGARAYTDWVSDITGYKCFLPSEAQWEYAAGGGAGKRTRFAGFNDDSLLHRYANFCDVNCKTMDDNPQNDGFSGTAPVKSFLPNLLGLYDMNGNVSEWCEDTRHENYQGAPADGSAWLGGGLGNEGLRAHRGGSFDVGDTSQLNLSFRLSSRPYLQDLSYGFRLCWYPNR